MTEKIIKTIPLKNGLTLNLIDLSKNIAGDRYCVSVMARIEIPVNTETLADAEKDSLNDIIDVVGDKAVFEKKMERNFISEQEKDAVLDGFVDSFLQLSDTYLTHPDFAKKYILKAYREKQIRQNWYR